MANLVDSTLSEFKSKVKECTFETYNGEQFVLVAKLKRWLRSTVPNQNFPQVGLLLHAAYRHGRQPSLPITSDTLCAGDDTSLLVFSILLELNHGHLIDHFYKYSVNDRVLPTDLWRLKEVLKSMNVPNHERLACDFDFLQWRFCPARFEHGMTKQFQEKIILPICRKELINDKGGNAQVWQIEVQEEFVGESLRKITESARYNDPKDNYGFRFQFALKRFKKNTNRAFRAEKEAFHSLRDHDGVVRYLGDYEQKETQPPDGANGEEVSYLCNNIILEFGDHDLDEFFYKYLPPVLQSELEEFWKNMFEIVKSVERIHNLKSRIDGVESELQGWHADIKPDNVLSVQGRFKLADPGFATFVQKTNKTPLTKWQGGTETYGAPECHPKRAGNEMTQSIDIWSLGCVFSIAATWVALGYQGVRQFIKVREMAIQNLNKERTRPGGHKPLVNSGDCFHDGWQVLSSVTEWHKFLRSSLRRTDTITAEIIDLVENGMLIAEASRRISATELHKQLNERLARSTEGGRHDIPAGIENILRQLDEEAPETSDAHVPAIYADSNFLDVPRNNVRQARKSFLQNVPLMKTSHRSSYRRSLAQAQQAAAPDVPKIMSPTHENEGLAISLAPTESPPQPLSPSQRTPTLTSVAPSFSREHSDPYGSEHKRPPLSYPRHSRNSRSGHFLDVFQAREAMEKSGSRLAKIAKRKKKDKVLTMHYGDRDIVFLVDNAETMIPFWWQCRFLLETLVKMLAGQDPNGMDLFFTCGTHKVSGKEDASKFLAAMNHEDALPERNVQTDMKKPLGDFFSAYLKKNPRYRKKFTLIVLTDGVWEGTPDKYDVYTQIISFLRKVAPADEEMQDRPVSIQFIQFGDDIDGTQILRYLDDHPKYDGVPDVIDTEPSPQGDIYKMLLGSFNEKYDRIDSDDADDSGPPMSPARFGRQSTFLTDRTVNESPANVGQYQPPSGPSRTNTLPSRPISEGHFLGRGRDPR